MTTPSPVTRYGGLPIPVPAKGDPDGDPTGDPGLGLILAYLAACLNARGGAGWASVAPGRDPALKGPLVTSTYAHDPHEVVFNESHLPALYGWRQDGQSEQIAADYHVHRSTLHLVWVAPTEQQETQRVRHPFLGTVAKLLDAALDVGRDPAWVMPGETDAKSLAQGSLLWEVAGIWKQGQVRWKRGNLEVQKGEATAKYPAVFAELPIEELLQPRYGDAPYGLDATLTQTGPAGDGIVIAFDGEPAPEE